MMELFSHICQFCCTVTNKDNLRILDPSNDQFLTTFFRDRDKNGGLVICSPCQAKLDNFKLFWLQFKTNSNLLNVFRSKQILQQQVKTEVKAEENKNKVLENFDNEIRQRLGTLTPLDFSLNGKSKRRESLDDRDVVPDTTHEAYDTHDAPHDDLDTENYPEPKSRLSLSLLLSGSEKGSGSDERRRQRNREASRRYRERARSNPELLRRMREQQNARQKKYYARLRQRKQSSTSSLADNEAEAEVYQS